MLGSLFLLLIIGLVILGVIFFFTPTNSREKFNTETYEERILEWEEEKDDKKEWFSKKRWLTDAEIDWGVNQLEKNDKYKVLPAYQWNYVQEANKEEADAHLAFTELLKQINDQSKELVFIPVNQPNFHWSLLVYEVKSKTFYHWDTLNGANQAYIQLLVNQLLVCLLWPWQSNQDHLVNCYEIEQGNSYDCGVAVISIIKRIQEKYSGNLKQIELGEFNFKKDRKELRNKYLKENGE